MGKAPQWGLSFIERHRRTAPASQDAPIQLFAAGVARDIVDELTGHEGEGTSQTVYKHDTPLPVLRAAIEKVEWPELEKL
jgi:hypothetical protein